MSKIVLNLSFKRETKGTFIYQNEEAGISGIYVPKELLPAPAPQTLKMTLEPV